MQAPPDVPAKPPATGMQRFGPVIALFAIGGILLVGAKSGMFNRGIGMMLPAMLVVGMVMMFVNRNGDKKQEVVKQRADYMRYLDKVRDAAIAAAQMQHAVAQFHYPRPQELVGKIEATSDLMWRRRADKPEFMHARIGLGTVKAARWFQRLDVGALEDQEPACVQAVNDLIHEHSFVRDIPRPISLAGEPAWALTGDTEAVLASARAILAHLTLFHGPDDLMVAVVVDEDRAPRWDAVKWLPHHRSGVDLLTFGSVPELMQVLGEDLSDRGQHEKKMMKGAGSGLASASGQGGGRPASSGAPMKHLVVLCDAVAAEWDTFMIDGSMGREGVTILDLTGQCPLVAEHTTLHFSAGEVALAPASGGAPAFLAVADSMSVPEWEAFARKLSRYRQGRKASRVLAESGDTESALDLMEMLNVADAANWDPGELWKWASTKRNLLRVPVGKYLDSRRPWVVDLKEGAHGPHFGVGGGTGAGKSDFLRCLVLALCMTHSPDDLIITPADFKGRKTFAGFERLPHVLVVLHNLDSSPDRIARLRQVFQGELIRRQELLEEAGDGVNDIDQYRAFRRKHPERNLPPMPHWFIPFDELMQAKREAPDLLAIMKIVGTVGRSLGAHMMPVSQTLNASLMEGIAPHLTGRLAMKMNNAQDYRDVIGTSSPGALPKRPGVGYFVEDPEASIPPQRVEDCFVRKPYVAPSEAAKEEESRSIREHFKPRLLSAAGDAAARAIESTYSAADRPDFGGPEDEALDDELLDDEDGAEGDDDEDYDDGVDEIANTVMAAAIEVMDTYVRDNDCALDYPFWLPELTSYTPVSEYVSRFLAEHGRPGPEDLVSPAGVVDLPRDLTQDVLQVSLRQNAVICGAPGSGKSLALASVVLGAAQMYSPERVQFYILDNGGGNLQFLENLAHVGEVVRGTGDRYAVDRLFTHIWSLFREREASWALSKIELGQWRRRRFGGEAAPTPVPSDGYGDVYFVIDQADTVCSEFPEHKDNILLPLAKRGPGYGIHLIFTQPSKQSSAMFKFADDFRHLYELKVADAMESQMMRQNAEAVPNFPGRGLISAEGTGGARRSTAAVVANMSESIPPDSAHHILFAAPSISVDGGELSGVAACEYVNRLHRGAAPARAIPQLPDWVMLDELATGVSGQFSLGLRESDLSTQLWSPAVDAHLVVMGDAQCGKTTVLRTVGRQLDAYASASPADRKPIIMAFDLRRTLLGAIQTANLAPNGYVYQLSQVKDAVQRLVSMVGDRASDEILDQDELLRRQSAATEAFEGPEIFLLIDDYEGFVQGYDDPFAPLAAVVEMGARSGVRVIASHTKDPGVYQMNRGLLPKARTAGAPILLMSDKDLTPNLVGKVKGMVLPAGRGLYIERRSSMMVQAATTEAVQ